LGIPLGMGVFGRPKLPNRATLRESRVEQGSHPIARFRPEWINTSRRPGRISRCKDATADWARLVCMPARFPYTHHQESISLSTTELRAAFLPRLQPLSACAPQCYVALNPNSKRMLSTLSFLSSMRILKKYKYPLRDKAAVRRSWRTMQPSPGRSSRILPAVKRGCTRRPSEPCRPCGRRSGFPPRGAYRAS